MQQTEDCVEENVKIGAELAGMSGQLVLCSTYKEQRRRVGKSTKTQVVQKGSLPSKNSSTVLDSSSNKKLFRPVHIFGSQSLAATCQFHTYVGCLAKCKLGG